MPLWLRGLLPVAILLLAACVTAVRRGRPGNARLSLVALFLAAITSIVQLWLLSPAERVDVSLMPLFPGADAGLRLDGLSLAFSSLTLLTGCFLVAARLQLKSDRRESWPRWLMTAAATVLVLLAGNLVFLFAALQLQTFAWAGAPRRDDRRQPIVRLGHRLLDLGLLMLAGSTIQQFGTSSFTGIPSDAVGPAALLVGLLPALARVATLVFSLPQEGILFEGGVAWMPTAGYLVLRLFSLTAGSSSRIFSGSLFAASLAIGAFACLYEIRSPGFPTAARLLILAQSAVGFALATAGNSSLALAATFVWLLLVPLAGLACIRLERGTWAYPLAFLLFSMLPPGPAFVGGWLGLTGLIQSRLPFTIEVLAVIALLAVLALSFLAAIRHLALGKRSSPDMAAGWAAALLLLGVFPQLWLAGFVISAARTIRNLPADSVHMTPFALEAGGLTWPALAVSGGILALLAIAALTRPGVLQGVAPTKRMAPVQLRWVPFELNGMETWSRIAGSLPLVLWIAFAVVIVVAIFR